MMRHRMQWAETRRAIFNTFRFREYIRQNMCTGPERVPSAGGNDKASFRSLIRVCGETNIRKMRLLAVTAVLRQTVTAVNRSSFPGHKRNLTLIPAI
jgi:hypothetical protein